MSKIKCDNCNGTGKKLTSPSTFLDIEVFLDCPVCNGTGSRNKTAQDNPYPDADNSETGRNFSDLDFFDLR